MRAEDIKRVLEESLHEGGMDNAPGPDSGLLADRVRGARRRRAAASGMAGMVSIALVAAVVWQVGGFSTDPNPPATPTQTTVTDEPTTGPSDPTDEPTGTPTNGESETPTDDPTETPADGPTEGNDQVDFPIYDGTLPDFSDAVIPECGDTFALPERTSALVVEGGPSDGLPDSGGGWDAILTNTSEEVVQGFVTFGDLVVVGGDGRVVSSIDTDFMGAEGPSYVGIAPGESMPVPLDLSGNCGELASGSYQAYAMVTFVAEDGTLEQAQGGPWPIELGSGESHPGETLPEGTVEMDLTCGATWVLPEVGTEMGLELIDPIRTPRSATDDIDGDAALRVTQPIVEALYVVVVVLKDGEVVGSLPAGDVYTSAAASPGVSVPLFFGHNLRACYGDPVKPPQLPAGDYEVAVVAAAITESESVTVLAVVEPTALVIQ